LRLVIFDLDGTLIDSAAFIVAAVEDAFRAAGEPVPDERAIRGISGITARDGLAILAPHASSEQIDLITGHYRSRYRSGAGLHSEPLFAGALMALDRLQAQPETILAVATGKSYGGATTLLERHGLTSRFLSIETPDHNRGKPDPQMIETAMAKAGVGRENTVMIGDTVHDMRMARAAGVGAIGVAWGYHLREELLEAGADVVIEAFEELDDAVLRLTGADHA
jgi:phosphoglycolate phosphatase